MSVCKHTYVIRYKTTKEKGKKYFTYTLILDPFRQIFIFFIIRIILITWYRINITIILLLKLERGYVHTFPFLRGWVEILNGWKGR